MADYVHLENLIQGEVYRITERRPLEQQEEALEAMIEFLNGQRQRVIIELLKLSQTTPANNQ